MKSQIPNLTAILSVGAALKYADGRLDGLGETNRRFFFVTMQMRVERCCIPSYDGGSR